MPLVVTFPDGTRIRASSLAARKDDAPPPSFGLYLDPRWQPDWPADHVDWPDFGLPRDGDPCGGAGPRRLRSRQAGRGGGGRLSRRARPHRHGARLHGDARRRVDADDAVTWVRENYDAHAVETPEQEGWVRWFAVAG